MKEKAYLKKLGNNIRKIRRQKGISQIEVADQFDADSPVISRLESGNTNPTIITLKKVADALGVEVAELVSFSKKKS